MDIDEKLRQQSKILLHKLKAKQGRLQQMMNNPGSGHHIKSDQTPTKDDGQPIIRQYDGETSGQRNLNISKSKQAYFKPRQMKDDNKENMNDTVYCKQDMPPKDISNHDYEHKKLKTPDNVHASRKEQPHVTYYGTDSSVSDGERTKPAYREASVRERRKIIDRNVHVDGEDLSESGRNNGLNFSYSKFDESDLSFIKSQLEKSEQERPEDELERDSYSARLQDCGNSKKTAKMIRDAYKPKSILQTTGPKSLKKSLGKVSFLSSNADRSDSRDIDPHNTRQLLGYDWIAALLDNDRGTMNNSESYFEELREFRRLNRDECMNRYYMEAPESLFHESSDPEPVKEILQNTKVKPYTVNDRLFTEPLQNSLFTAERAEEEDNRSSSRKPTYEEPRFVRVSIPRSTLLSPHRVKPHRRKSLEDTDSFSLSQHCMKGYENSVPSMVPSASNIGLRDASVGLKSKMQTDFASKTLNDAEKIAASFPYAWDTSGQDLKPIKSNLYSSYHDMTLPYSMRSNIPGVGEESVKLKQATEDLLNSTYSLMYEMQNMRKSREICT